MPSNAAAPAETVAPERASADAPASLASMPVEAPLHTPLFFRVFAAVMLYMTGVSLQFHIGHYFAHLGHDVDLLGRVLAVGAAGVLLVRFQLGRWIDTAGCRRIWLVCMVTTALAVGLMQFTTSVAGLVALRLMWNVSQAAVMTTFSVFAGLIAPPHRRAESLGTMGLSGFVGMTIGPTLGDVIFATLGGGATAFHVFFTASALCSLAAATVVFFAVRLPDGLEAQRAQRVREMATPAPIKVDSPAHDRREPLIGLLWRYLPASILPIAIAFHMTFCLQMSFLERLAAERGFDNIKLFFLTYAPTAIVLRIAMRRLPEQIGRRSTVLLGAGLFLAGLMFLLGVQREVGLILPGILMGAGHCFIFPSMIDLCASAYPREHRGLGTSLVLGAGDVGILLGFAILGGTIAAVGYDWTIVGLGGVLVLASLPLLRRRRPGAPLVAD